jgi:hypothetical protein
MKTMATRSNALMEIARFWLQECHGLLLRESVPVKVKGNYSDIDFVVTSPTGPVQKPLLGRITFTNAIVETKNESYYDPRGTKFAKILRAHYNLLDENYLISAETKCHFSMLKELHHEATKKIFGRDADFSKIFIFHNLDRTGLEDMLADLQGRDIHFVTSFEMLADIQNFFTNDHPGAGVRNSLVGDILDMLVSYHGWGPRKD